MTRTTGRSDIQSRGDESDLSALEPGLLSLLGDTLVDALAKPDVGVHVPRVEKDLREVGEGSAGSRVGREKRADLEVGSELDGADANVARSIVMARGGVESEPRNDESRLAAGGADQHGSPMDEQRPTYAMHHTE